MENEKWPTRADVRRLVAVLVIALAAAIADRLLGGGLLEGVALHVRALLAS